MRTPKLFDAAYIRMTAWYVLIIMTISLLFSVWVYNQARSELRSGLNKVIELKSLTSPPYPQQASPNFSGVVSGELAVSGGRLVERLVLLNLGVLVVGSVASYWLARRTMRPIEEAVEAQERFTADASHELRTPLAAMKTEIEVGLRDKKLTKDDAISLLKSNLEEVDRLGNLAEGLLTLTQNDAVLSVKLIPVTEVAQKVIQRLQPLAQAKNIVIKQEFQPLRAAADEAALDKIIGILLDNAIKYSPEHTSVTLKTYQKGDHMYVTVQDEGVGIKATELPHIFDRFYRADSSRSKQHVAGHGLGLSIAQKLAESMNATVTAHSEPGKGSEFRVLLSTSLE